MRVMSKRIAPLGLDRPKYAPEGMKLFRFSAPSSPFFAENIERAVLLGEIFLSSRRMFNDPFDMSPIMKCDWTLRGIATHARNIVADPRKSVLDSSQIRVIEQNPHWTNVKLSKRALQQIKNKFPNYLREVLDEMGVICFTEELQNPILWAHYAGSYQGVCLQFTATGDTTHPLCNCMKVNYTSERPAIYATQTGALATVYNDPDWNYIAQYGICTKSADWAIEREWRVWIPNRARSYLKLPPKCIKAVFLGPLATSDTVEFVRKTLAKAERPPKLFLTTLSDTKFQIGRRKSVELTNARASLHATADTGRCPARRLWMFEIKIDVG